MAIRIMIFIRNLFIRNAPLCICIVGMACAKHSGYSESQGSSMQERPELRAEADLDISNNDIKWDGTPVGLHPILSDRANELLLKKRPIDLISILQKSLKDQDRFVAAHVMLGRLTHQVIIHKNDPHTSEDWDGLHVVIWPDGHATYYDDREKLIEIWHFRLQKVDTK